eukprot:XP_013989442.1 PREDICTED: uncharacterized protein LOC106566116 [Salmo salar]
MFSREAWLYIGSSHVGDIVRILAFPNLYLIILTCCVVSRNVLRKVTSASQNRQTCPDNSLGFNYEIQHSFALSHTHTTPQTVWRHQLQRCSGTTVKKYTGGLVTADECDDDDDGRRLLQPKVQPPTPVLVRVSSLQPLVPLPALVPLGTTSGPTMANHLELLNELQQLDKVPSLERLRAAQKRRTQQLKRWAVYEKEMQNKKRKAEKRRNANHATAMEAKRHVSFAASVALLEASARNDPEEVRYLLKNNVSPDLCNEDGLTALHQVSVPLESHWTTEESNNKAVIQ